MSWWNRKKTYAENLSAAVDAMHSRVRTVSYDTHKKCRVCGKWDHYKNLLTIRGDDWGKALDLPMDLYGGAVNKPIRFTWTDEHGPVGDFVLVHPECNKVEECNCHNGWRKKVPGSSVVERGTVNPDVAGSSPAPAANGDEGRAR